MGPENNRKIIQKMPDPKKILIVKLSAIGDVVHSLPFLEVLRGGFPGASIDWIVEEDASQIIMGHPALDRVLVSRRKSWQKKLVKGPERLSAISEIRELVRRLRSRKYDIVIDLQGLFKSGMLVGMCKAEKKIGMEGGREGGHLFLNERPVPVDYEQHAVERYLQIAAYLGCNSTRWEGEIPVYEANRRDVDYLFDESISGRRPVIAMNPIAKWDTKLWQEARFAKLADRLIRELNCDIIFTGSSPDIPVIKKISKRMQERSLNLAGKTGLKELACLYAKCRVVITTDTGPMHIAAAMGCPVVALFGPTSPKRTGPYGQGHRVIKAEIECSPCFMKRCDHMSCMKEITVDAVFEAVSDTLKEPRRDWGGKISVDHQREI